MYSTRNSVPFILSILFCFIVIGCESNFRDVQKMGFAEFSPSGDADGINLKDRKSVV